MLTSFGTTLPSVAVKTLLLQPVLLLLAQEPLCLAVLYPALSSFRAMSHYSSSATWSSSYFSINQLPVRSEWLNHGRVPIAWLCFCLWTLEDKTERTMLVFTPSSQLEVSLTLRMLVWQRHHIK